MAELYWLKRPIAHRGLHDQAKGIIENSASSVRAAMGAGYAIEVDLQCAADHIPIVFHDRTEALEKALLYEQLKHFSAELEEKVQAATSDIVFSFLSSRSQ